MVTNGFYPEISPRSYRATELALEFSRLGHEVVVITKHRDFNYKDFLRKTLITLKMWPKSTFPKIPGSKWKPLILLNRAISRILLMLFEYPGIEDMFRVKKILKDEDGYDLLISFAVPYPVHWGVAWSKSKRHPISEVWIADCGDPYMGDVLDTFRKLFYFKYLEKWFSKKADFITIPVNGALKGYYPEFHYKIRIIPQGFSFNLCDEATEEPFNDVPTFAYAGGFLPGARDPKPLMEYLINLKIPFKFFIYTNKPELFNEYKKPLGEKLVVSHFIPRDELLKKLRKMNFLLNFDNNTSINSPSKLIDYSIVKRPVFNINKHFNKEELNAFFLKDYSKRLVLPNPEQYHITTITQSFLDLSDSVS